MLYPLSYGGATSVPTRRPLNTFAKCPPVFKMSSAGQNPIPFPAPGAG
jgi:hypothetical protein